MVADRGTAAMDEHGTPHGGKTEGPGAGVFLPGAEIAGQNREDTIAGKTRDAESARDMG